jgi:hypothetical protein
MEEFRFLKYRFLLIAICVQIIGIVVILAFWFFTRYQKIQANGTGQLASPDEKFSITKTDNSTMPSQNQTDTIILNLGAHGYIQGRGICDDNNAAPLAQYFGGIRYALPPSQRWAMARRLPVDYSYGSSTNPGKCDGRAVTCPQPFMGEQGREDCFECNVWTPVGRCPDGGMFSCHLGVSDMLTDGCIGWPVVFYIRE